MDSYSSFKIACFFNNEDTSSYELISHNASVISIIRKDMAVLK